MSDKVDEYFLLRAIALSREALDTGDGPFGAVIVKDGKILAAERNRTKVEDNPTLHAEMVAIREACREHGANALVGSTIYCSCEPCLMCLLAITYSEITQIVYAATIEDAIKYGSGDPLIHARDIVEQGKLRVLLVAGGHRDEAVSVFKEYAQKYGSLAGQSISTA